MNTHTMKDGTEIAISAMDDSHLMNTLAMLRCKSVTGVKCMIGESGSSAEDMWGEEQCYFGEEMLKMVHYSDYLSEAYKRGLLINRRAKSRPE